MQLIAHLHPVGLKQLTVRTGSTLALTLFALLWLSACDSPPNSSGTKDPQQPVEVLSAQLTPSFVGSDACQSCHTSQYELWRDSHHALAMQPANLTTVLAKFPHGEENISLNQEAGQFFIAEQDSERMPITHTFGVAPLQQYLADTGNGRLQTLRESWDARPAAEGGQRWFRQYPAEAIPPGDVLHWQGVAHNWNSSCADCHTTGFAKGYEPVTDTFSSSFAEMGVSCESCHGPASAHITDPTQSLPAQTALSDPHAQPDVCAPCHARRAQIAEGYTAGAPLMDYYVPQLLNPPLYHADGQIDDEVYVYGSFLASKMHQQGVTCSDCHEPHSAQLVIAGDGVCLQCHTEGGNPRFPSLEKNVDYTLTNHHGHDPSAAGARCVACHMPTKVYMGVDTRHDHSLRIPNLHTAEDFGMPSACTNCHAATPVNTTSVKPVHFANLFAQNRSVVEGSLARLALDPQQNTIVRATALSRVIPPRRAGASRAIEQASKSQDPLIRHTSVSGVPHLPAARRDAAMVRLLQDPMRSVRIEAAAVALTNFTAQQRNPLQPALDRAVQEYIAANELNAEQPAANVNLATIYLGLGHPEKAEKHLQRALKQNPEFAPALLNFADLLRLTNRDVDAQPYLVRAVNLAVALPTADYAYALWLVRNGSSELALPYLQRAAVTDPETPQWSYAYAVALHSLDQSEQALALLRSLTGQAVYQEQLLFLHASIARDVGLTEEALALTSELLKRAPSNTNYRALSEALSEALSNREPDKESDGQPDGQKHR